MPINFGSSPQAPANGEFISARQADYWLKIQYEIEHYKSSPWRLSDLETQRERGLKSIQEQEKNSSSVDTPVMVPHWHPRNLPIPTINERRVQQLRKQLERWPDMDARQRANRLGVIEAYESGALDLTKKPDSEFHGMKHITAIFWDGKMMRGWGDLDDGFFEHGPKEWKMIWPDGRVWVESGLKGL
ncbi:hypothetical protein BJ508DRAFT_335667 [Ascobolus immersus RN42]|uniref:Uncharacterized protein n=1 Tax=Ascobolus immersus RN42 TaxID=1160509 RepID=A0A3N4HF73_ASCIM|nr:hypothetical protein BJ508DRAFT_335667 [Ascobolus immersus RN42]